MEVIYKHVKSESSDPKFIGEFTGQGAPFLTFTRAVNQSGVTSIVELSLAFIVEGVGSSFQFNCYSKSLFEVYFPEKLLLDHVYEMHRKTVTDLDSFIKQSLGKNGMSPVPVPMPTLEFLQDELHAFIFRFHFGPNATNQLN